jgi:hypothetical protein
MAGARGNMADVNSFLDKTAPPDDRRLAETLGKTWALWAGIRTHVRAEFGPVIEEWKYYGVKYGWTLKTLLKKRNLFFFTARKGSFRIAFVFGDKAVAMVEQSDLPKALIEEVRNAKKYAEGRGLRIDVKTRRDVEHVKKLVAIKSTS